MNHLKYEKEANAAFKYLGFEPRRGQVEAVCQIVYGFLDEKMQNQILCAPTGTGKSLIGAVSAETLSLVKNRNANSPKSSISLVSTNVLAKQYGDTFNTLSKDGKYIMIKGASNYDCSALSQPHAPENAESCAWFTMMKAGAEFDLVIKEHCNKCEYLETKKKKNLVRHLTTNYSYFFVDRMYTGKFEDRDLVVWDEAHLVNDLFSDHNAIVFSQKRVQAMAQEIADAVRLTDLEISKILVSVAADCGKKDKINDSNYVSYLNALQKVYKYAAEAGSDAAQKALHSNQMSKYTSLNRFTKKYEGLNCKISDFFTYNYEHVFENKEEDSTISIKPVFVGTMMEALQCSSHNLFMSATVSGEFMIQTMNLNPDTTKFIKLAPTFPKENKEIVFFDPLSLSYVSLQNPDTVKSLRKNAGKIVKKHITDGDRGIILTPSFKLQAEILAELKPLIDSNKFKMFEHRSGEKLENILNAFKGYTGGPAILVSPAMFEGIDLPGDLSRFQVFVKAPYPSLGDKRMKFILDKHPEIYEIITIMKLVQGAGRSVRSETDHATTYMLDKNAQRLMQSSKNIWKDEFTFRFTNML